MTSCTNHGDLMRDLALGKLEDRPALEAEVLREECRECSMWWDATFTQSSIDSVDSAVGRAFEAFVPPARRHYGLFAAAAAAILAVGISSLSLIGGPSGTEVMTSLPAAPEEVSVVSLDFENGLVEGSEAVGETAQRQKNESETALFVADLESGDLSSWTING